MNQYHAYDKKMADWEAKNYKLEDFEDINPAMLNPRLTEIYNKLKAEAAPKEPIQADTYEPASDLFSS